VRRGQILPIALALIASAALASLAALMPSVRIAGYRGIIQSTELVIAARMYWANRSSGKPAAMEQILNTLWELDRIASLDIPQVNYTCKSFLEAGLNGAGALETEFSNGVSITIKWSWNYTGTYVKLKGTVLLPYKLIVLRYVHLVKLPQVGTITFYPQLTDPAHLCELEYVGDGTWYLGIPYNYSAYTLVDEHGISVSVILANPQRG